MDLYASGYIIGQGMTTEMNGIPICIAYHKQQNVNITHHSGEEYFLDWIDFRSSGKEDLANYYGRTLMKADILSTDYSCNNCQIPNDFSLESAYPNPFNGKLNFEFKMPDKQAVEFQIYDLRGNLVYDRLILPGNAGLYQISWDAKNVDGQKISSGVYFYSFKSNGTIEKGKLTYLK